MEIWKDVLNYEGLYQVSNLGRIKSLRKNKEKILTTGISCGYLHLSLYKNKKGKSFKIHRLIMLSFRLNEYFENAQVNHIDGNKLNNHIDNLEWCTEKQNIQHSFNTGLQISVKGEKNGLSKLTEEQVLKIREDYKNKYFNQTELSKIFNVNQSTISGIVNNKIWKQLV